MKLFPLITTIILLPCLLFSQSNFQPAQVTTTDGTTLKGYIDYDNWEKTPDQITFKTTLDKEAVNYKPTSIKAFNVDNQEYVSQEVAVEISPRGETVFTFEPATELKPKTVFLKKLVDKEKKLFVFVDEKGNSHFYIFENEQYKLLLYKEYLERVSKSKTEHKNVSRINKKYVEQLESYLKDCPIIKSYLSSAKYNEKSLRSIFENYFDYFNLSPIQLKEAERGFLRYGLMVGGSITQPNFEARALVGSRSVLAEYLGESEYNHPLSINGGLFVNYILPKSKRKLVFTSELFFYNFQTEGFREDVQEFIAYYDTVTVGYVQMNLNLGLKYQYPINDRLGIYARLAIINSLLLQTRNSDWRRTTTFPSGGAINEKQEDVFNTFPYENGFLIGIGIQNSHLFVEIRSELKTNSMSNIIGIKSTLWVNHLLIGYKF